MKNKTFDKKKLNLIAIICILMSSAALGFCFLLMPAPTLKNQSEAVVSGVYAEFIDDHNGTHEIYQQDSGTHLLFETPPSGDIYQFNGWQRDGEPEEMYSGFVSDGTLRDFSYNELNFATAYSLSPAFIEAAAPVPGWNVLVVNMWVHFNTYGDAELLGIYDMNVSSSGINFDPIFVFGTSDFTGLTCVVNNDLDTAAATGLWTPYDLEGNWHMLTVVYSAIDFGGGARAAGFRFYVDGEPIFSLQVSHSTINFGQNPVVVLGGLNQESSLPYDGLMQNWGLFCSIEIVNSPVIIKEIYDLSSSNVNYGNETTLFMYGEQDMSFTAKWKAYPVTLTIDANGGSYGGATSIEQIPETTTTLSVPTREGYKFKGWSNIGSRWSLLSGYSYFEPYAIGSDAGFTNQTGGSNFGVSADAKNGSRGFSFTGVGGAKRIHKSYAIKKSKKYTFSFWAKSSAFNNLALSTEYNGGDYNNWQGAGGVHYTEINQWQYLSKDISGLTSDTTIYCFAVDLMGQGVSIDDFGLYKYNGSISGNTYTFGLGSDTLVAIWEASNWVDYAQEPTLNADGYYHVSSPEQLAWFAKKTQTQICTDKIKLVNDIDLSKHRWTPIGSSKFAFTILNGIAAEFDGQGHTIKGMLNATREVEQGLFGKVWGNVIIKNLTVKGVIYGRSLCGGIIGTGNAVVQNCASYVNVFAENRIGGIVGANWMCRIENSFNYGKISGIDNVGGISGDANNFVTFENVYNFGEISGNINVGGLLGSYVNPSMDSGWFTMRNSYNEGNVTGMQKVGGLIGFYEQKYDYRLNMNLANCMTKCTITTKATDSVVGSLIGEISLVNQSKIYSNEGSVFRNCVFIGEVITSNASFGKGNALIGAGLSADFYVRIDSCYAGVKANVSNVQSNVNVYTNGNFADFSYVNGINGGMPVPSGLFWIGGVGGQNVVAYLQGKGYTLAV